MADLFRDSSHSLLHAGSEVARRLFDCLEATEVLTSDEVIGIQTERGFKIDLSVGQSALGEADQSQVAECLVVVWIHSNYRLHRNPDDGEAHTKLGRALAARGQTSEGLKHLLAAVRINPNDDKAHYELGYVYLAQNHLAEADQEFQAVIRVNPDDYQAFGNLGLISLTVGRLADAQIYLETALRLNPDDLVARKNLIRLKAIQ